MKTFGNRPEAKTKEKRKSGEKVSYQMTHLSLWAWLCSVLGQWIVIDARQTETNKGLCQVALLTVGSPCASRWASPDLPAADPRHMASASTDFSEVSPDQPYCWFHNYWCNHLTYTRGAAQLAQDPWDTVTAHPVKTLKPGVLCEQREVSASPSCIST